MPDQHDMRMRMLYKHDKKEWKKTMKWFLGHTLATRNDCKKYDKGSCKEWSFKYQTCLAQAMIWAMNGKWEKLRENRENFLKVSGTLLDMEMEGAMENDDHSIFICGQEIPGEEAIRRIGISMKGDYECYAEWCDIYEDL